MKLRHLLPVFCLHLFCLLAPAAEPLRIFIRSGPKSHGPGAHDHPSFLKDWVPLLNERGAKAAGGDDFPTKEQLAQTDVLIIHRDGGGDLKPEEQSALTEYTKRGGGIVVIHAGTVANTPEGTDFYKQLIGGSWRKGETKFREGPMHLYFTDRENPITKDMSNFAMEDEIYYDMDVDPAIRVLAGAYTPKPSGARDGKAAKRAEQFTKGGKEVSIYDIQPEVWMWEPRLAVIEPKKDAVSQAVTDAKSAPLSRPKDPIDSTYRAFVCIPGHNYANFNRPNFRALLLRGIAWAGKRANADELCKPDELGDNLRYVEGGPTRPEKAAEKLDVHPEFNISLVASEPLINKAMNIDWDEKGRLWVCETPEYPNGRRELNVEKWKDSGSWTKKYDRDPIDRICWLEDTNGDGIMDKKHVFADKLELVTSFCFYKNGVIACSAPDIWYLEDTTGKGVCDKRTKLYTGLGTGDTHAVINNLRWGRDGWVYATHGYSSGHVTSPDGSKEFGVDGSGVVRFKPDGSAFEQYSSRGGNTWGLDITSDGQVFFTQPTSGTVFFHVVLPEYVLAKGKIPGTTSWKGMITGQKTYPLMSWPEQAYVQIDQVGNFTAAAGCAIYEGGAWPEKWNYSYFTTEPTLNIVHHEFVEKDGVSYKVHKEPGREETEFIRSKDLWFRPIEVRVGPDGALYVIDFYNQAVIHNDTRGPIHGPANAAVRPDRDHYFGRIWKVQHKQAKKIEVPVLDKSDLKKVASEMQSSPNSHTRMTAARMIKFTTDKQLEAAMPQTVFSPQALAALKNGQGKMSEGDLLNTSRLLLYRGVFDLLAKDIGNPDLSSFLTRLYPQLEDNWSKSAIIALASLRPDEFIGQCFLEAKPELASLVSAVVPEALQHNSDKFSYHLIETCANAGSKADSLKAIILQRIAEQDAPAPALTPDLTDALKKLLAQPALAPAALPLAVKWDKSGALADVIKIQVASLNTTLAKKDAPMPDRIGAARALIHLGGSAAEVGVKALAETETSPDLARAIIEALDETGNVAPLVASLATLKAANQQTAFDAVLKRPEATLELLNAIQGGKLNPKDLGPGNVARLRTHPNKQVAKMATQMMDKLNPNAKAKNDLIAQFTPEVEKPGDAAKGKIIFTAACAVCHHIGDLGKFVGPPLDGMGAHAPSELIIHILDPNREVDPSFWAWNITKKNGETLAGVIASENAASVTLRNQAGDFEVKKDDIKERVNTRLSLMPEGLEGLGAENLRDIIAFLASASNSKFRILDLRNAYTADSREGVFAGPKPNQGQVRLAKYGNVTVEGIPFYIQDAAKSATGSNLIVLKGGPDKSQSTTFPAKVEVPLNVDAKSLQLLSGIAGWGYPAVRDEVTALHATVMYASGDKESFDLKNGVEFADYIRPVEVPGSKLVEDLSDRQQLRLVTLKLSPKGVAKKLILESPDHNPTAPVVVAITADLEGRVAAKGGEKSPPPAPKNAKAGEIGPKEGGKGDGPLQPATPVQWEAGKTKVLVIGGGSSHNFAKFFGGTDVETLKAAGFSVHYTEDRDQAAAELAHADVAVISVNRKFFDTSAYRKALFAFANAGKGLIMLHPGTWYGYGEWPELNAQIVGGGARGHDAIDKFTVSVLKKDHPVMAGVPATFDATDELYYINAEPEKTPPGTAPMEVLAQTSPSKKYKAGHPSVWTTQHPKARIVGIALGHDERVHDSAPFKTILTNAVKWTSGK